MRLGPVAAQSGLEVAGDTWLRLLQERLRGRRFCVVVVERGLVREDGWISDGQAVGRGQRRLGQGNVQVKW